MREVHLDCEFIKEDLSPTGLISIGLLSDLHESGDYAYYAVNGAMDLRSVKSDPFLMKNVWPQLPLTSGTWLDRSHPDIKDYGTIRSDIDLWFHTLCRGRDSREAVRLVVYCGGQDTVRLQGLWNHDWLLMPKWIPRYAHDLEEDLVDRGLDLQDFPEQEAGRHHALHDARHQHRMSRMLQEGLVQKGP